MSPGQSHRCTSGGAKHQHQEREDASRLHVVDVSTICLSVAPRRSVIISHRSGSARRYRLNEEKL
jgi:hypothetical protein